MHAASVSSVLPSPHPVPLFPPAPVFISTVLKVYSAAFLIFACCCPQIALFLTLSVSSLLLSKLISRVRPQAASPNSTSAPVPLSLRQASVLPHEAGSMRTPPRARSGGLGSQASMLSPPNSQPHSAQPLPATSPNSASPALPVSRPQTHVLPHETSSIRTPPRARSDGLGSQTLMLSRPNSQPQSAQPLPVAGQRDYEPGTPSRQVNFGPTLIDTPATQRWIDSRPQVTAPKKSRKTMAPQNPQNREQEMADLRAAKLGKLKFPDDDHSP